MSDTKKPSSFRPFTHVCRISLELKRSRKPITSITFSDGSIDIHREGGYSHNYKMGKRQLSKSSLARLLRVVETWHSKMMVGFSTGLVLWITYYRPSSNKDK